MIDLLQASILRDVVPRIYFFCVLEKRQAYRPSIFASPLHVSNVAYRNF